MIEIAILGNEDKRKLTLISFKEQEKTGEKLKLITSFNSDKGVNMKKLDKLKNTSWRTRQDGRIELRFYKDNKRYSVYGFTQEEVLEKYKTWKPKVKVIKKVENKITFEKWYNEWIEKFKMNFVAESTIKSIRYIFNKHILLKLKNKSLTDISTDDIQSIINSLNALKRQQTIAYNYLNQMLKKAYKLKLIKENPCEFVEIKKVKQISKKTALTITEQKALTTYLIENNHKLKNLILTYINTGMRKNELLNLTQDDIDRVNNVINVRGTKTKSSVRSISTTKEIIELIPKEPQKPFEIKVTTLQDSFKKICKNCNIRKEISIHSLRHTFATRCLENGINIKMIQKWLGHATMQMTTDVYSHVQTEMERRETEKLKDIFKQE